MKTIFQVLQEKEDQLRALQAQIEKLRAVDCIDRTLEWEMKWEEASQKRNARSRVPQAWLS